MEKCSFLINSCFLLSSLWASRNKQCLCFQMGRKNKYTQIAAFSVSPIPFHVLPMVFLRNRQADVTCQPPLWASGEKFPFSVQGLDKRGLGLVCKAFCGLLCFTEMKTRHWRCGCINHKIVYAHVLLPSECWENCCAVWLCVSLLAPPSCSLTWYTVEMKLLSEELVHLWLEEGRNTHFSLFFLSLNLFSFFFSLLASFSRTERRTFNWIFYGSYCFLAYCLLL